MIRGIYEYSSFQDLGLVAIRQKASQLLVSSPHLNIQCNLVL
jgi:hypothetical protein